VLHPQIFALTVVLATGPLFRQLTLQIPVFLVLLDAILTKPGPIMSESANHANKGHILLLSQLHHPVSVSSVELEPIPLLWQLTLLIPVLTAQLIPIQPKKVRTILASVNLVLPVKHLAQVPLNAIN